MRADGDELLVERARRGDRAAFGQLVVRHDEGLRRLAWRLLRDASALDDVLQEAYVKAFLSLGRFRGDASFKSWLYRIVYNACLDELRRPFRQHGQPDAAVAEVADGRRGPGEVATDRAALSAALDELPVEQRAAVLLVDAEGHAYDDAAVILGVAAGTVASRVARGRAALRRALGEEQGAKR